MSSGFVHRLPRIATLLPWSCCALLLAGLAPAQPPLTVDTALLQEVFPGATEFSAREGDPPVWRAWGEDRESGEVHLLGYLFQTPDFPPQEIGYSGPIDVLVGMDLKGAITGVKVLHYIESYKSFRGDFINDESFPGQFQGKNVVDGFRVGRDVDGISRATITSWAMARGIRNAARTVARAWLSDSEYAALTSTDAVALQSLAARSWEELTGDGLVVDWRIPQPDLSELRLTLAFMGHEGLGELLVGVSDYSRADREASNRAEEGHLLLVGIDGNSTRPFRQERLAVRQGERSFPVERRRFVYVGSADEGRIADRMRFAGALILDPAVDLTRPFTVLYDTGAVIGESDVRASIDYQVPPIPLALAQGVPVAPELLPAFDEDLSAYRQQGLYASLIHQPPWLEVSALLALFSLVMSAFLLKSSRLRWVALGCTLVYLGWLDGSFVSVSHITNAIALGPSMFRNDLPQVMILAFTVVTTLVWGRVFCSSLCPFGALQDFISHFLPRHFQKELPRAWHERAIYLKYGILGLLVVAAVSYSELSLFQYFEPFGTIFYFSRSWTLWLILLAFLAASVLISRFYCRYACPLGAALGLAALLSPLRIRRVRQCEVCTVCEQACPTGAIRGPDIDFKECVRCDVCEIKLSKRAGVCKHTVEEVAARHKTWQPVTVS